MNRPHSIPPNYVQNSKGEWCHPSRVQNGPQTHAKAPQSDSVVVADTKTPKRIRQSSKPLLNKLEQRYLGYLSMIYVDHPIISQGLNFRLANGCWYCPDFVVWGDENNCTRAFEVKGNQPIQDDSVVKIKVAAKEYHWLRWYLVWWKDDQWQTQLVIP